MDKILKIDGMCEWYCSLHRLPSVNINLKHLQQVGVMWMHLMPVKPAWSIYKISLEKLMKDIKKVSMLTDNFSVHSIDTDQYIINMHCSEKNCFKNMSKNMTTNHLPCHSM